MLVVGLTGGIATGKSTASSLLKARGIPIVDADVIARDVVQPSTRAYAKIVEQFGDDILSPDKTINRPKLGSVIFEDEVRRKKLNAIVHPAVRYAMIRKVLWHWLSGERICVVDVPLLVEVGLYKWMGKVIVVYCSEDLQLQRLMARDKSTRDAARSRIMSQMPVAEKVKYADIVIDNSGSVSDIDEQIERVVHRLRAETRWTWRPSWLFPPIGVFLAMWVLSIRTLRRRRNKHE